MDEINTTTSAQYSLGKILVIWAAVAVPMPIMAFWIAPILAERSTSHPGVIVWLLMIDYPTSVRHRGVQCWAYALRAPAG